MTTHLPHPLLDLFEHNRCLKSLTTFAIGGPARYFIEVSEIALMQKLIALCHVHQLSYQILGKGSNTLFDDQGYNGLVIANRISFCNEISSGLWHVGAGFSFSLLGTQTARSGWTGLEFASGIPASVGGAVFMNAGANGLETCHCLVSVDYVNAEGELMTLPKKNLNFAYRSSWFQTQPGVIVAATFQLSPLKDARQKQIELFQYRKKTQPYGEKSAGCVFRNPSHLSAGLLIDQSGLKGKVIGGAQVSPLHANFIVNKQQATAKDVLSLIQLIIDEVKNQTGVELENEVRYIPYD